MPIHCCLARMPRKCEMGMPIRILSRQYYEPLPPQLLLKTASFARLKFMRPVLSPHSKWVATFGDAVNCSPTHVLQGMPWSDYSLFFEGFIICVALLPSCGPPIVPLSVAIALVQKPFWSDLGELIKSSQWGNLWALLGNFRIRWFLADLIGAQILIIWNH